MDAQQDAPHTGLTHNPSQHHHPSSSNRAIVTVDDLYSVPVFTQQSADLFPIVPTEDFLTCDDAERARVYVASSTHTAIICANVDAGF